MAELKYTKHLLGKIEEIFKEIDYTIRYAKGNFQSGYCLVEQQKIVVVNKFYETEGRINVLIDILDNFTIEESTLTEKGQKTYKQVMKQKKEEAEEKEEESKDIVDSEEAIKEESEKTNTIDSEEVITEDSNNTNTSKEEVLDQDGEVNKL